MRRTAALLVLAVAGTLFVTAPSAQACPGELCDVLNFVCYPVMHKQCFY